MVETYTYRDIVSTILMEDSAEHEDHPWVIKWKNDLHDWGSSKLWVKDLEKGKEFIYNEIRERLDAALEREYRQMYYEYRDITLEIRLVLYDNKVDARIENKYIDTFNFLGTKDQIDDLLASVKEEIRRRIDIYLLDKWIEK